MKDKGENKIGKRIWNSTSYKKHISRFEWWGGQNVLSAFT